MGHTTREGGQAMRVAIVTETFMPQVNGVVRTLVEFLAYLRNHGHEAIVFAPGDGERACHGAEIVRVNGLPCPFYPEVIVAPYSLRMGRILRDWRADVMHLAGPFVLGMHGLGVARSLGVPVAAHFQTDIARYADHFGLGALAGLAWRRLVEIHNACDVTFAPTAGVAAELRQRGMQRVHVSGRGVDATLFHPAWRDMELRQRLGASAEQPLLLYVGRISPEKNLAALVAVARALPQCPLLIVGDGPARGLLAAQLAGLNVHFAGTLHGAQLATAYASADVFLFPSATETFGQVAREAMAAGLPVVGVRAGGVRDVVCDGVTGLLCQPGDIAAYVAAARRLALDGALRRQLGAVARREAEEHTWECVFDHLLGWYAGIAGAQEALPVTADVLVRR